MIEATPDARALAELYDDLSRYQLWRRRLARVRDGGLEMHKRLRPAEGDRPGAGTAGLHSWLWDRLEPTEDLNALDLGCGFGATLFSLAERAPAARLVGWSLSPFQVRQAEREARRLQLEDRTRFQVRSFDDPWEDPSWDLVLSVESLFHAPDLAGTLARVAAGLAPGGRLVAVEDQAADDGVREATDARALLSEWSTARLHTGADWARALAASGFEVTESVDLTPQVPVRTAAELARSERRLRRLRSVSPSAGLRRVLGAYLGGVHLERLYLHGAMRYRLIVARVARG